MSFSAISFCNIQNSFKTKESNFTLSIFSTSRAHRPCPSCTSVVIPFASLQTLNQSIFNDCKPLTMDTAQTT